MMMTPGDRRILRSLFNWICLVAGCLCLISISGCAPLAPVMEKMYLAAPSVLPCVVPEMKTPGFWVGRLAGPDQVVLDSRGIRQLNQEIREELALTKDVAGLAKTLDGRVVASDIRHWLTRFRDRGRYFGADGQRAGPGQFADLEKQMALPAIPDRVVVRWGLLTANADQRLLPTSTPLYREAGDIDFDRLQNNGLDMGTPVAVLHQSADAQWFWVRGPASDGWVRAGQVGLCDRQTLTAVRDAPFATVIRNKASLYTDPALTRYGGWARMGTRFMLADAGESGSLGVLLPFCRDNGQLGFRTGYIRAGEAVRGSLAYTRRHIIEQAFEMLNAPYGWGGSNGEQDCSQFIQAIFSTVGIQLPRNSAAQAVIGRALGNFKAGDSDRARRTTLVQSGLAGTSVLYMKGHVMLYLGTVKGRPYAIHELWGYREPGFPGSTLRVARQVAVTGLDLGKGTGKGSLLERLTTIRGVF